MPRFLILDRHFDAKRVHVSPLEDDGVYLVGLGGAGLSDITREDWAQLDAAVLSGMDAADERRSRRKTMMPRKARK